MKTLFLLLQIFLITFFFGCSGSSNPTIPQENSSSVPIANVPEAGTAILGAGTMNLDTGELIPSRDLSGYLNVTPYLGSNFSYSILRFIPPCYFEVEFSLTNFTSIWAWDVCLVFENLYGKSVIYDDGYIDIYQPYDPDPVIMFETEEDDYAFPPFETAEANGLIRYPAGASPLVDYFIIAHLGGNTGGVKYIDGWISDGVLMPDGGTVTAAAYTEDYQYNIQFVVADTTPITGGLTFFSPSGEPNEWTAEITNSQIAPSGYYDCWLLARSPSTPQYNTYYKMTITVSHYPTTVYVDDDNVNGPWDGSSSHPFRLIQDAVDYCVDGDTIWVMPGVYHEGEQRNPYEQMGLRINSLNNVTIHGDSLPKIFPANSRNSGYESMIEIFDCTNTIFEGFEITPVPEYEKAFSVNSSSNVQIKNCVITPSASYPLKRFLSATYTAGLLVEGNIIDSVLVKMDSSLDTYLIELSYACNNAVLSLNTIQNLIFDSIPTGNYLNYYVIYSASSDNVSIVKNKISDIDLECSISEFATLGIINLLFSNNHIIRNNLIHDIHFTNPNDFATIYCIQTSSSDGTSINNNTIDSILTTTSDSSDSRAVNLSSETSNLSLHSNIITRLLNTDSGWSYGVASSLPISQEYSDVWSISSSRYHSYATGGIGDLNLDPYFVDYANNDYHLDDDPPSPCIGTGKDGFDMGCYGGTDPLP